jgi:hypothetical protein
MGTLEAYSVFCENAISVGYANGRENRIRAKVAKHTAFRAVAVRSFKAHAVFRKNAKTVFILAVYYARNAQIAPHRANLERIPEARTLVVFNKHAVIIVFQSPRAFGIRAPVAQRSPTGAKREKTLYAHLVIFEDAVLVIIPLSQLVKVSLRKFVPTGNCQNNCLNHD